MVKRASRNRIEYLILASLLIVVVLLIGANIYYQRQESKQKAMYYQLQILRNGINLFKVVENRNPTNLAELANSVYKFPGDNETRRYLTNVPFNKLGELVDSFGNVFLYDHATGWVRSGTSGYEIW